MSKFIAGDGKRPPYSKGVITNSLGELWVFSPKHSPALSLNRSLVYLTRTTAAV